MPWRVFGVGSVLQTAVAVMAAEDEPGADGSSDVTNFMITREDASQLQREDTSYIYRD